jgi:hypothetical protein
MFLYIFTAQVPVINKLHLSMLDLISGVKFRNSIFVIIIFD